MLLTLLIGILASTLNAHDHECIHHHVSSSIGPIKKGDPNAFFQDTGSQRGGGRLLAETSWRKINIVYDTSLVSDLTNAMKAYIMSTALPIVKDNFESFVNVRGSTEIPPFRNTVCDSFFTVPDSYASNSTTADLLIFVKIIEEDSNYLAYAVPCRFEATYNRPVVGLITINKKSLKISAAELQTFVYILMHESLHILVISPSLYDIYYGVNSPYVMESQSTITGKKFVYKLVTPKLLATAKSHYNCSNMDGVYLEDEGSFASAGAHFEKSKFGNELMTSKLTGHPIISRMTLSLMEDSGWYQVDYNKSQDLAFGANEGCEFLKNSCHTDTKEYCTEPNAFGCSKDYLGKTLCKSSRFTNGCYLSEFVSKYVCTNQYEFASSTDYEENGADSRCFLVDEGDTKVAGCFKATCESGKVLIQINKDIMECHTSGEILTYKSRKITCPDITDFCGYLSSRCANDCNGRGACLVDSTCRCDYFYSGSTCNTEKPCESDDELVCPIMSSVGGLPVAAVSLLVIMVINLLF